MSSINKDGLVVCDNHGCSAPQCVEARKEAAMAPVGGVAVRFAEFLTGAPLDEVPLPVLRKLEERANQSLRDRQCLSRNRTASCELEKGHDGPHKGTTYDANPPDTASPRPARLTWDFL